MLKEICCSFFLPRGQHRSLCAKKKNVFRKSLLFLFKWFCFWILCKFFLVLFGFSFSSKCYGDLGNVKENPLPLNADWVIAWLRPATDFLLFTWSFQFIRRKAVRFAAETGKCWFSTDRYLHSAWCVRWRRRGLPHPREWLCSLWKRGEKFIYRHKYGWPLTYDSSFSGKMRGNSLCGIPRATNLTLVCLFTKPFFVSPSDLLQQVPIVLSPNLR